MHPVLWEFAEVKIYTYGFFLALGFLTAVILILNKCRRMNIDRQMIVDLAVCLLVSGLVGGRLLHVLVNSKYYFNNPLEIIMVHHGGLAYQGGLTLAVICGWIFLKRRKISFLLVADIFMPYVALAQAIGRIGCYFNGCCYGKGTASVFGVNFPGHTCRIIPTQLYYSLSWLIIFAFLSFFYSRRDFSGQIFCFYFLFYGAMRFLIDYFRGDLGRFAFNMTLTQIISLFFIIFSVLCYTKLRRNARREI